MKKFNLIIALLIFPLLNNYVIAGNIKKLSPTFWWAGMKDTTLQVMMYGDNLYTDNVSLSTGDIKIKEIVKVDNPNYLIIYLDIAKSKAQKFNFIL